MSNNQLPEHRDSSLKNVSQFYIQIKKVVLLAENYDKSKSVVLTSINEIRNAAVHIFRAYIDSHEFDEHIEKAKGHLFRAGYDSYEVVAIEAISNIKESLYGYKPTVIQKILPDYYTTIKPRIIEIERELSDVRSKKDVSPLVSQSSFDRYENLIDELIGYDKQITKLVPSFSELQAEEEKHKIINNIKWIIPTIVAFISCSILIYKLLNKIP